MEESKWSPITEGWDGGTIDTDELVANLKTVARNSVKTVGAGVALLYAPLILLHLFGVLLVVIAWVLPSIGGVVGMAGWAIGLLAFFISFAIGLVIFSLYRPMQQQAFEGKSFVSGGKEALMAAKEVVPKVAITVLMFWAVCAVGALACGIGAIVAAFFFIQAPYLAATTELQPMECMRRSYELNKQYAMPIAIGFAVSLVAVGALVVVGGGIAGVSSMVMAMIFPPLAEGVMMLGIDIISIVVGFVLLVIFGTLFTTIQSIERGVAFRHD